MVIFIYKRFFINSDWGIVIKYFRKVDFFRKWINFIYSFDFIYLFVCFLSLLNCKIYLYSYIRGSKGEKVYCL